MRNLHISDDIISVTLPAKEGNSNERKSCSCNGAEIEANIGGLNITLGECKYVIGPEEKKFCFVDEDAPCAKNETQFKALPGTYYSTEPCASLNETKFPFITFIGYLIGCCG